MKKEYDFTKAKRGPVIQNKGKTRITIYLDTDIIENFRKLADGNNAGYQTMINNALREHLNNAYEPIDEETLRRVIREELHSA